MAWVRDGDEIGDQLGTRRLLFDSVQCVATYSRASIVTGVLLRNVSSECCS
jgi:hypothetical protein